MKNRTPLRRTPLRSMSKKRMERNHAPSVSHEPRTVVRSEKPQGRMASYAGTTSGIAVEKLAMLQHKGYMAAVRSLGYCMRCKRSCSPQFCHRDEGKGTGIKTDCREGWPGCPECHWIVGTSGTLTKEQRRAEDLTLGQRTRVAVIAAGLWPARLPQWERA